MTLDELLDNSRPQIAQRTPELLADLRLLASEPSAKQSEPKVRRRATVAAFVALSVVGLGTAAVASGHLPFGWTTTTGRHCFITSASAALTDPTTTWSAAASQHSTAAQREATVREANRYLRGYDFAAIDVPSAEATWKRAEAAAIAAQPVASERQPRLEGDELEVEAMRYRVQSDLKRHIEKLGLPFDVLMPSFEYTGTRGTDGVFRCSG